jgi:hypothetical protein
MNEVDVSAVAAFCGWQVECGRRGWTADALRRIAERWGVIHATTARSRNRLVRLGLVAGPGGASAASHGPTVDLASISLDAVHQVDRRREAARGRQP